MIYITGDCHGDWTRFGAKYTKNFTAEDVVIVAGDFGIWKNTAEERYWLDWLAEKPFTILFIDGNHENFDRLNAMPEIDYCGGKAHMVRPNVFHLMRGYVFTIQGKKIFAFGGARSHDIQDGILDRNDFPSYEQFAREVNKKIQRNEYFRIRGVSWWDAELPTEEEMERGRQSLMACDCKVDYVITHCAPYSLEKIMFGDTCDESNPLTIFLDEVVNNVTFSKWFFGHYHQEMLLCDKFYMLYQNTYDADTV